MSLKREQIVDALKKIVGEDQVVTDEQVLKESSVDRFRRFEAYHGVYRLPLPAAVVHVNSSKEVAAVIKFANENKINVVPRTGHSATEGGLETALENSREFNFGQISCSSSYGFDEWARYSEEGFSVQYFSTKTSCSISKSSSWALVSA